MKKSKNLIAWFYIVAVAVVIPVFNRGTFDNITQHKVEVYYLIAGISFALYLILSVISDFGFSKVKASSDSSISLKGDRATIAACGFGIAVVLSFLLSEYKKDAFYGVPGFGMGTLSLVVMLISAFFISREFVCSEVIYHIVAAGSVIPTILVIANRLGYDPLGLYAGGIAPQYNLYVSTFGNYGWFCEYMSLIFPILIYMVVKGRSFIIKGIYGAYLAVSLWAISLAGTMAIWLSVGVVIAALVVSGVFKRLPFLEKNTRQVWPFVAMLFVLAFIGYVCMILFVSSRDGAGNGRGYIWSLSLETYRNLSLKDKFFGVGPNCYMHAVNSFLEGDPYVKLEAVKNFKGLAITSAHSEYLDYLVNMGIVGAASYLCMIFAIVVGVFRNKRETKDVYAGGLSDKTYVAFLCVLSYLFYAGFNFSIVCATPLFFVFLGILWGKGKHTH